MFCNKPIEYNQTICVPCAKLIPLTDKTVCLVCGKKKCICKDNHFTKLFAPFYYEMGADNAVKNLKFNDYRTNAKKLAIYMADCLMQSTAYANIDIITPVPPL